MIFYDESFSSLPYPYFHASSYSSSLIPLVSSPSSLSSSSSSSSYQTFSWHWRRTKSSPVSAAREDCQARDRSSQCQERGQLGPRGHHSGHSRHSMIGDPVKCQNGGCIKRTFRFKCYNVHLWSPFWSQFIIQ